MIVMVFYILQGEVDCVGCAEAHKMSVEPIREADSYCNYAMVVPWSVFTRCTEPQINFPSFQGIV